MLLTEARAAARLDTDGELVRLADQDRSRWDRELVAEGRGLVRHCLVVGRPGPYQLQAAIAAVHTDADDLRRPTGRRCCPSTTSCGRCPATTSCTRRAEALRRAGRIDEAAEALRRALALTSNATEQRHLQRQLQRM